MSPVSPAAEHAELILRLLTHAGHPVEPGARILDFGCGRGEVVKHLGSRGLDAYGCDFPGELGDDPRLRPIGEPYRLPFDENTFQFVVSHMVLEHVMDHRQAFREIRRVLAPDGASVHIFPPRYSLQEGHTFVPLATVLRARPWLWLWALLGVRNQYQQGKGARETMWLNREFLLAHTNYPTRRRLLADARAVFPNARLLERETLADRPRARRLVRLPGAAWAWSETRRRSLLLV